ncbi:MAG: hypothetical protein RBU37_11290 [Myxococcota bacterium]|jgi:ribosomal protein L37AE/L43A|nr:hypothetical protein [Myxococcota bacterium]
MSEHDYEEISMWQDILDDVISGRLEGHLCPFCGKKTVEARADEAEIYVKCNSCGKWIEGAVTF